MGSSTRVNTWNRTTKSGLKFTNFTKCCPKRTESEFGTAFQRFLKGVSNIAKASRTKLSIIWSPKKQTVCKNTAKPSPRTAKIKRKHLYVVTGWIGGEVTNLSEILHETSVHIRKRGSTVYLPRKSVPSIQAATAAAALCSFPGSDLDNREKCFGEKAARRRTTRLLHQHWRELMVILKIKTTFEIVEKLWYCMPFTRDGLVQG